MSQRVIQKLRTQRGYGLLKTCYSDEDIRKIKKELKVQPFCPAGMIQKPKPFNVFLESPKRLWVPDNYGMKKFGPPDLDKTADNVIDCSEHMKFKGSLREYQINLLKEWDAIVKRGNGGGILSVPCGYGKTVMSIYAACMTKKKTLIVVHKEFLMNQFRQEIQRFVPTARIGRIQGPVLDIENKDIVLGMLQSITLKDYPANTFSSFGMVIFDECHHLAAEVFSRALGQLCFQYKLGLSATPKRKDGLSKVFHYHLGDFIAKVETRDVEHVLVKTFYHNAPANDEE